jgi:hypothetical protein
MPESAVLLTALIVEHPLCLVCIAEKTHLRPEAVHTALTVIERVLRINKEAQACQCCGAPGTGYFLKRPKPLAVAS